MSPAPQDARARAHEPLAAEWLDLSAPIGPRLPVWPGDPPLRLRQVGALARGDPSNLTELAMSAHVGTHVDAPLHFIEGAAAVHELPLGALVGRARVLHLDDTPEVQAASLAEAAVRPGERLLLRTRNSQRAWWREPFQEGFVGLSLAAARLLAERQVACVGVDYLSVGGFRADGPAIHRTLLAAGVVIIEGLVLERLAPGPVDLVCLPLRLEGSDGAPARAMARPLEEGA
jgi:arylformamidase